jgi:hypothetical protein
MEAQGKYKLQIIGTVNGRVSKSAFVFTDNDDKPVWSTEGKVSSEADRAEVSRKAAEKLSIPEQLLRELVEKKCNEYLAEVMRARAEQQQADQAEREKKAARAASEAASDEDEQAERLAKSPAACRDAAARMLPRPDLLDVVADDVTALGVAGERNLVKALYLVGTSRLLDAPAAARVKGPSSSGKSYVVEKVAGLFPAEAVIRATTMTPQALYHMRPGGLKHRWVVGGERSRKEDDDVAEATRALREMLSSGRLSKLMPMKVGGEIVSLLIEQEGPIAYVETTTMDMVFAEDENRCLSYSWSRRAIGRVLWRDSPRSGRLVSSPKTRIPPLRI